MLLKRLWLRIQMEMPLMLCKELSVVCSLIAVDFPVEFACVLADDAGCADDG